MLTATSDIHTCSGLILAGGTDLPLDLMERQSKDLSCRDAFERALVQAAIHSDLPLLGICRGFELINLCLGGSLRRLPPGHVHAGTDHRIQLQPTVAGCMRSPAETVNSFHNWAVAELGPPLIPLAWAPDGVIEAACSEGGIITGIQWHPERAAGNPRITDFLLSDFFRHAEGRAGR